MKNLVTFLFSSVLILLFTLFIVTCRKEYSYEGSPEATFSLVGTPNECINFEVSGAYSAGIPADSNNRVTVTAQVITAGSYAIITNTVNGISFSASGVFADTGYQTVVLQGNGTPAITGIYNFAIIGDSGCTFLVEVINKPLAGYLLSGSPGDCENPVFSGNYVQGKELSAGNIVVLNVSVITAGDYAITTDMVNGISFSSRGTFTTTGNQQVTLTGAGIPSAPGFFYFHLIAGASQCTFRLPVVSAEPYATYVLESGIVNNSAYCTPHSIQGSYTAGTPLDASNTITITAYVTITGNYTLSTDSYNGIIFSASGGFTTTGQQSVVLYGSGTPVMPGTFNLVPQIVGPSPIGGAYCGIDIPVK